MGEYEPGWGAGLSVDTSTATPPPAIISTAGDAMTQAQTGVSQGWDWFNSTLQNTVDAVAKIGVAKYAARNGVALQATTPLQQQNPTTGQLFSPAPTYSPSMPQQQQGPGLMTVLLIGAVAYLALKK